MSRGSSKTYQVHARTNEKLNGVWKGVAGFETAVAGARVGMRVYTLAVLITLDCLMAGQLGAHGQSRVNNNQQAGKSCR